MIEYEDFRAALDVFAEMATDDVDIEFEIERKQTIQKRKSKRLKNIKFWSMESVEEGDDEDGFENEKWKWKWRW